LCGCAALLLLCGVGQGRDVGGWGEGYTGEIMLREAA